jgi:hypothetical protein
VAVLTGIQWPEQESGSREPRPLFLPLPRPAQPLLPRARAPLRGIDVRGAREGGGPARDRPTHPQLPDLRQPTETPPGEEASRGPRDSSIPLGCTGRQSRSGGRVLRRCRTGVECAVSVNRRQSPGRERPPEPRRPRLVARRGFTPPPPTPARRTRARGRLPPPRRGAQAVPERAHCPFGEGVDRTERDLREVLCSLLYQRTRGLPSYRLLPKEFRGSVEPTSARLTLVYPSLLRSLLRGATSNTTITMLRTAARLLSASQSR